MGRASKKEMQREADEKFAELQQKVSARVHRLSASPVSTSEKSVKLLDEFNTRTRERIKLEQPAVVICEEDTDTPATIVDTSKDGLRLRFAKPHYLPATILIDAPVFSGFVVADVKWQSGNEAGVAFDHEWTQKLSVPLQRKKSQARPD